MPKRSSTCRTSPSQSTDARRLSIKFPNIAEVSKIDKVEDSLDGPSKLTMIYDNLPKDEAHGWKCIAIGPDDKLHVPIGQPCMTMRTVGSGG